MIPEPAPEILENLGDRLRQCRIKKFGSGGKVHGSAKLCAEALGLSLSAWSGYESGRTEIGFTKVVFFAEFFAVGLEWLLTGKETQSKQKPSTSRAEGALFNEKIQAIMDACTTVDAALRQCLLEAAAGRVSEDDALDLFGEIVTQIKEFRDKKRLPDAKQATA